MPFSNYFSKKTRQATAKKSATDNAWLTYLNGESLVVGVIIYSLTEEVISSLHHVFLLASDGTLVVEDQGFITGVALVFPMAIKVQGWRRFPRTSPVSTGLEAD